MRPDADTFSPEFDHVFQVLEGGEVVERSDLHAPSVCHDETADVVIDGKGWQALTGWTGQYGYKGAGMHSSEQFAGNLAAWVLANPGVYTLVVVEMLPEESDEDPEPAGWAVLVKGEEDAPCCYGWVTSRQRDHEVDCPNY